MNISLKRSLLQIACIILLVNLSSCAVLDAWLTESGQVAREQLGPREALRKYEWFKDASANLDSKRADIKVLEQSLKDLEKNYAGTSRKDWAQSDLDEQAQLKAELNGVRSSYNDLAAQYNAGMAKVNFAFANVGQLPQGATVVLPREFKPYID